MRQDINFLEKFFQEYHQGVKQFESRSSRHSVRPDLGSWLYADDKKSYFFLFLNQNVCYDNFNQSSE